MQGLVDTVKNISPFIGSFSFVVFTLLIPAVLWARRMEAKVDATGTNIDDRLSTITDNHLHHLQENTQRTNDILIEIKTILVERRGD